MVRSMAVTLVAARGPALALGIARAPPNRRTRPSSTRPLGGTGFLRPRSLRRLRQRCRRLERPRGLVGAEDLGGELLGLVLVVDDDAGQPDPHGAHPQTGRAARHAGCSKRGTPSPGSPIHRWSSAAGDPTGDSPGRHRGAAVSRVFRSCSQGLQIPAWRAAQRQHRPTQLAAGRRPRRAPRGSGGRGRWWRRPRRSPPASGLGAAEPRPPRPVPGCARPPPARRARRRPG